LAKWTHLPFQSGWGRSSHFPGDPQFFFFVVFLWHSPPPWKGNSVSHSCMVCSEQEANTILCHCHFWSVFLSVPISWLSGGLVPCGNLVSWGGFITDEGHW
jgi:hypothetical protein